MLRDVRYAIRRFRQSPVFSFVVVATLALGIGANSAIFSVVNTVLLAPLPYRDPARLVTIYHFYPTQKMQAPVSAAGYRDYRDQTHSFADVAVESSWRANLTGQGEPEPLTGKKTTGRFFPMLGVPALLGRGLLPDDETEHRHVVVLSFRVWQRTFGGDRAVIGRTITLNDEGYQVIGVMPATFVDPWTPAADVWAPMQLTPANYAAGYTNEYLQLTARLKPGVTVATAAREMTAFARRLKHDQPANFPADWTLSVVSMVDVQTGNIRPALLVLLGAVGFVLLIACANVANLLLARAASRRREVAVRTALGARPRDLIRQLLAESLLLAACGGAAGLAIAYASIRALIAANPANVPRLSEIHVDGHVVWFTVTTAVITGVVFGLMPAVGIVRHAGQHDALRERSGTSDRSGQLLRRGLVVAEVALALTLLTGGGLLLRSFARLSAVQTGFNPHHVLTFGVALPPARYASDTARTAAWTQLIRRLAVVPGVQAVAATSVVPFGGNWSTTSYNVEGYTPPPNANSPWGDVRVITPAFFTTMDIPIERGRALAWTDDDHAVPVAVVDDEFVRHYITAGVDPIGKRLYFGNTTPDSTTQFITIVGVVGHTKHESLDAAPRPQLYLPVTQQAGNGGIGRMDVVVRTGAAPFSLVPAVRRAMHDVDRDLPMASVTTMDDLVAASMGQRRLSTILLGVFAGLALLLASLGIYGVMSYTVAQRTREMGVRVALGATRENVLGMVLRQGLSLAVLGVVIGLVGTFAVTRVIAGQLYDVTPTDPVTLISVTALLLIVAAGAVMVPALRATRVDPVIALREE